MALWSGVGQVASMAQLAGVDAYGLISMIVEAAKTVRGTVRPANCWHAVQG